MLLEPLSRLELQTLPCLAFQTFLQGVRHPLRLDIFLC